MYYRLSKEEVRNILVDRKFARDLKKLCFDALKQKN
jgi:hypothetical protein